MKELNWNEDALRVNNARVFHNANYGDRLRDKLRLPFLRNGQRLSYEANIMGVYHLCFMKLDTSANTNVPKIVIAERTSDCILSRATVRRELNTTKQ